MKGLTSRQKMILEFIEESLESKGFPPTIREIADYMGIRSPNGVNDHLNALEKKGYLERTGQKSRGLRVIKEAFEQIKPPSEQQPALGEVIPILGRVAAGLPIEAQEEVIDHVVVDPGMLNKGRRPFGLRVQGESMIEAGIMDGDYIFVRPQKTAERGEIVVVTIDNEATCKYFYPERDRVVLKPANSTMTDIVMNAHDFRETVMVGKVVGVYRKLA